MSATQTSFQKGQSGNPNGRPKKGYSITETMREMFGKDPSIKEKLVQTIIDKAIGGDVSAMKLIINYTDGVPKQQPDQQQTQPDQPLHGVSFIREDD